MFRRSLPSPPSPSFWWLFQTSPLQERAWSRVGMGLRRWKGGWKTEVVLTVWDPLEVFFLCMGSLSWVFHFNSTLLICLCFVFGVVFQLNIVICLYIYILIYIYIYFFFLGGGKDFFFEIPPLLSREKKGKALLTLWGASVQDLSLEIGESYEPRVEKQWPYRFHWILVV